MRMRTRHLGSLLAVCLVGSAVTIGAQPASAHHSGPTKPSKSHFYTYHGSKPLRKIKPGTILKQRTETVALDGMPTPLTADQLLYRTTNQLGKPSVTVTTVLKPPTAAVHTQIVAYLSFYDALGSECDPSYTLIGGYPGTASNEQQAELEQGLITQYLLEGDVVTVPDFEGTSLDWAAGQESGYGALDGIKATEHELGVPHSTRVGLSGYSGGSIAADWASELVRHYDHHLHIVGVAEGGIPVDFAHNLTYINGSKDWSGVIPAVLVSLTRAFGLHRSHFLSKKGKKITGQVKHQCIGSFLGSYPHLRIQQLLKHKYRHFLKVPAFIRIINTLLMGTAPGHPKGPLFMGVGDVDGTGDGVMVTKDVEALAHEYCKQGVSVQFNVYHHADHETAAGEFEPGATAFLAERLAGTKVSNGCSSIGKGNSLKPLKDPKKNKNGKGNNNKNKNKNGNGKNGKSKH
jgi:hypothetical protein